VASWTFVVTVELIDESRFKRNAGDVTGIDEVFRSTALRRSIVVLYILR
jgi:hypothetical protein